MRFAVYLLQDDNAYRDLEATFEADSPRAAAQQAYDRLKLHPDEQFPQLLVIPDGQVHIYTRDDSGKAVTLDEDWDREIAKGPDYVIVNFPTNSEP